MHTNLFNIVLLSFFLTLGCGKLYSQEIKSKKTPLSTEKQTDKSKDAVTDTIKLDTVRPVKTFLDGKVKYRAKENLRLTESY
ncbi:hypothetical protein AB9T88_06700 [Flavobacterium sp. LBUM151]